VIRGTLCERLAYGHCVTAEWPGIEPAASRSLLDHANVLTVRRTNTRLGDRTGVPRLRVREFRTVYPPHCGSL